MKDKILYLIIGVLIGAIITAGCFMIFGKKSGQMSQGRFDGDRSNMVKGERPSGNTMGTPLDMQTSSNTTTSSEDI